MKLVVFGGTFNPIHIGHLAMADDVCNSLGYDKILFVPTYIPPHKIPQNIETPENRIAMLNAAFRDDLRFEVEPCEIQRGGTSYTIDTIHYVIKKYQDKLDSKPGLLMGQETAAEFSKWRGAEEIAELCDLIVAKRIKNQNFETKQFENVPSRNYTGGFEKLDFEKANPNYKFIHLQNQILPISSTEIRTRISKNNGWRYLVSKGVFEYIVEHKLYGFKN